MESLQPSDVDALKERHEFVRDDRSDEANWNDYKTRLARRYYNGLYKDRAIVNLTKYSEGKIGLRWRTKQEVVSGKGMSICAATHCTTSYQLQILELPFAYKERGVDKQELVTVVLCTSCYKKLKHSRNVVEANSTAGASAASGRRQRDSADSVMGKRHAESRGIEDDSSNQKKKLRGGAIHGVTSTSAKANDESDT